MFSVVCLIGAVLFGNVGCAWYEYGYEGGAIFNGVIVLVLLTLVAVEELNGE